MAKYWVGVASREHVVDAVEGGFCQFCHGKLSAVHRLSPGDWIVYYSPRTQMRGGDVVQSFTAIGQIKPGEPYAFDMGTGFVPARRDVRFIACKDASIRPLIEGLEFIEDKQYWGYAFRRGLIEVSRNDFQAIAKAMRAREALSA